MGLLSLQIILGLILGINSFKIQLQDYLSASSSEATYLTTSSFTVKVDLADQESSKIVTFELFDSESNILSKYQGQAFCKTIEKGSCVFENLRISNPGSYYFEAFDGKSKVRSPVFQVQDSQDNRKSVFLEDQSSISTFYLDFISITPSEISEGTEFEVKVGIYDSNTTSLAADDSQSTVTLALSQPDLLQGVSSVTVESGVATFSGLEISQFGSYNLTASSSGLDSVTYSQEIIVTGYYLEFISVSPSEILEGSEFEVKVGIYDKATNTLVTGNNEGVVSLTLSEADQLQGNTSVVVESGVATFSGLNIPKSGYYNLTASSSGLDSVTYSSEIVVTGFYLEFISVSPSVSFIQEVYVRMEFEVKVGVYNKNTKALATEDSDTEIDLALSEADQLQGNTSVVVQSGVATFSALKIPKYGSYSLTASSSGLDSVTYSQELLIKKWPLTSLDVSMPNFLTRYFEFEFQVNLIDGSQNPFEDPVEVTLSSNLTITGTTSVTSSDSSAIFTISCKESGPISFTVSSGTVSTTFDHYLNDPFIKVTAESELTQSSNLFNVTIQALNYERDTLLTLTSLKMVLTLDPEADLYGNTSAITSTGEAELTNIVIIEGGSYSFLAAVYDNETNSLLSTGSSIVYEITEEQSNLPIAFQKLSDVKIESSNLRPTIYFTFQINIYLYNQIGKSYDNECEAGIVGSTLLQGNTYKETESGQTSFDIYSKQLGNLNILATVCDTFSRSIELVILPLTSKISVTDHIDSDSNYFDIKIGIYDNEMVNLESTNMHYNTSIFLSPSGQITGSTNYPHVPGEWTFQRVSILSSGNFTFRAEVYEEGGQYLFEKSADKYFQITKQNAKVPSDLLVMTDIIVSTYANVSVFEPFYMNTSIKDQEGNAWIGECNVVVNANMTIYGETSKLATTGDLQFKIYFKDVGYTKVTILTCDGLTKSFYVTVLPYTQKVNLVSHIVDDSNYFDVLVEVYDSYGESVLNTYGNFKVELYLIPDGNLTSNVIGNTVKGSKYFSPVTILSPGSYQIAIDITEQSGLHPLNNPYIVNETFEITEQNAFIPKNLLMLSYLEISLNVSEPTVFFAFDIKVDLFDQINSTWFPPTLIQITSNNDIFGETAKYSENGEVTFTVYFKNNGEQKLIVQAESGLNREIKVNILRERLQIEPVYKVFENSHYFNVTVDVLDNSLEKVEDSNGNYSVTLFSVPESEIHGNLTTLCDKGMCKFTGISIKNNGTYRLGAKVFEHSIEDDTAPDTYTEVSYKISKSVAHIYLYQIELYQSSECTEYVNSEINVLLLDINGALYNESIEYSISSSSDYTGPEKLTSIDGNSTFKYFYTQIGFEEISVSTISNTETITIEVKERMNYPLLALIILFWLMIICCTVFYVNDKSYIEDEFSKFGLDLYCPILVFRSPGANHRRIVTTLRVFASLFAIFTLIGLFYNLELLDSPKTEEGLEAYGLEDWYEGFIVLFISQCYTVPFAFLHYFNLESSAVAKIISVVSIVIIVFSLVFAIWSLLVFTAKYYLFWVITFVIYAALELFVVHTIYAIVFFCFFYKPHSNVNEMSSPAIKTAARPLIPVPDKKNSLNIDNLAVRAPRISFLYRK